MKKQKKSRAELSKETRRLFAKFHVDMEEMFFTANPYSINLTGTLLKTDGSEFTGMSVEPLVNELIAIFGHIDSDLTNWDLTGGSIRNKQKKKDKEEEVKEFDSEIFDDELN